MTAAEAALAAIQPVLRAITAADAAGPTPCPQLPVASPRRPPRRRPWSGWARWSARRSPRSTAPRSTGCPPPPTRRSPRGVEPTRSRWSRARWARCRRSIGAALPVPSCCSTAGTSPRAWAARSRCPTRWSPTSADCPSRSCRRRAAAPSPTSSSRPPAQARSSGSPRSPAGPLSSRAAAPMKMPKATDADKEHFRSLVPDAPGVEVKPMFGQLGAFVNGNMFAGLFAPAVGSSSTTMDAPSSRRSPVGAVRSGRRPMGGYVAPRQTDPHGSGPFRHPRAAGAAVPGRAAGARSPGTGDGRGRRSRAPRPTTCSPRWSRRASSSTCPRSGGTAWAWPRSRSAPATPARSRCSGSLAGRSPRSSTRSASRRTSRCCTGATCSTCWRSARPGARRLVTDVGVRLPAHLTASGRAILCHLPAAQVRALYPDRSAFVDRTGVGPESLTALRIGAHRHPAARPRPRGRRGHAGLASVAAPVLDHNDTRSQGSRSPSPPAMPTSACSPLRSVARTAEKPVPPARGSLSFSRPAMTRLRELVRRRPRRSALSECRRRARSKNSITRSSYSSGCVFRPPTCRCVVQCPDAGRRPYLVPGRSG